MTQTLEAKRYVESFFANYVSPWLIGDIDYCCSQDKSLAFTVATMVFTGTDFFGGLLAGCESTRDHFVDFVRRYWPNEYKGQAEMLYKYFRCGLVHQYFPKQAAAIGWSDEHQAKHLHEVSGYWFLHAKILARDFREAVRRYKDDLLNNSELRDNFIRRLSQTIPASPPRVVLADPNDPLGGSSVTPQSYPAPCQAAAWGKPCDGGGGSSG